LIRDASGKSYSWDFENRLTQAVVPGTNGGTTTFKYDPFGRRIQKSGPLGTTNYLYDGMELATCCSLSQPCRLPISSNRYFGGRGHDLEDDPVLVDSAF
jgi:YD repeat-containing protein